MSQKHAPKVAADYMTPFPHTIGADQNLASAAERMWQLGVRHLPVMEEEALVGIVSARDIAFARSFATTDAERTRVDEAMMPDPLVVGSEMPFGVVARLMAERKVGAAIVAEGKSPVGIVTTVDALSLLAELLEAGPGPSEYIVETRRRVSDEHRVIRLLLSTVTSAADRVLGGEERAAGELNEQTRELYQTLLRHFDLEDALLVPALTKGNPELAKKLAAQHTTQRAELRAALSRIDTEDAIPLAKHIQRFGPELLADMRHEEEDILPIIAAPR